MGEDVYALQLKRLSVHSPSPPILFTDQPLHLSVDISICLSICLPNRPFPNANIYISSHLPSLTKFYLSNCVYLMYLSLALKTSRSSIINTDHRLQATGRYQGAGTLFDYRRRSGPDCPGVCIFADGPTTEPVEVQVQLVRHLMFVITSVLCV